MAVKSLKNAVLAILDGAGTPKVVTVLLGQGNVTWTENYGYDYETERGTIATGTVRDADEQPVELNVTAKWENTYYEGNDPDNEAGDFGCTPYEALKGVEAASSWVSTGADACEPYCCAVRIRFDVECGASGVVSETVTFQEFRCESCAFDVQAGTLVFSGKSKEVRPLVERNEF
jgi:hypothetical protein